MIKVSITLPNSVQITLESDSEIVHEILETVLKDLPKELLSGGPPVLGGPSLNESDQLNKSSLPEGVAPTNGAANLPSVPGNPTPVPANPTEDNVSSAAPENSSYHQEAVSGLPAEASKDSFIQFCRSLNPLGDMRKVVVAAEGAEQFLRADGVDAEELSRLFELAGWTQPHSFNQTLRNAARSKFRWIERMPGRNGRYGVTDRGKEIARQG